VRAIILGLAVMLSGCAAMVQLQQESRQRTRRSCEAECRDMGLALGAVVTVQGTSACVCEPADRRGAASRQGAGVAVERVLALRAEEAARKQREEDERRRKEEERARIAPGAAPASASIVSPPG
jgi:hypothetical protein